MELVYLWVGKYKNIENQGFDFSPRFKCEYDEETKELTVYKDDDYINIFPKNINVTTIVGENGSGKSNMMKSLFSIIQKVEDKLEKYLFIVKKNKELIILYKDKSTEITYSSEIFNIKNKKITSFNERKLDQNLSIRNFFLLLDFTLSRFGFKNDKNYEYKKNFSLEPSRILYLEHDNEKINTNSFDSNIKNFGFYGLFYILNHSIDNPFVHEIPKVKQIICKVRSFKDREIQFERICFNKKSFEVLKELMINIFYDNKLIIEKLDFLLKLINEKYIYLKESIGIKDEHLLSILSLAIDNDDKKLFESLVKSKFKLSFKELKDNLEERRKQIKLILSDIDKLILSLNNIDKIFDYRLYILFAFYDFNIIFENKFEYNSLSSGQTFILAYTGYIVRYINYCKLNKKESCTIFIDEFENTLHPQWQKKILNIIIKIIDSCNPFFNINLIFLTHSPFLLSDIPKENIIYLKRKDGKCLNISKTVKIKSFGANIHTLLSDSFFMKDGLMGEFAKNKISQILYFLSNKIGPINIPIEQIKPIIKMIGEDFLREKLLKMYDVKFPKSNEEKINELELEIKRLKSD